MRRTFTHALAAAGLTAVMAGAALGNISSPPPEQNLTSAAAPVVAGAVGGSEVRIAAAPPVTGAEQGTVRENRSAQRVALSASLEAAARARLLAERAKVERARVEAARARAAAVRKLTLERQRAAERKKVERQRAERKRAAARHRADAVKAAAHRATAHREAAEKEATRREAAKKAAVQKAASTRRAAQSAVSGRKPRDIAREMMQDSYGWGGAQFSCYNNIIMRESGWRVTADNPGSSAYGIPQALPGSKMASAGPDWRHNATTQIRWGLSYVKSRYGTPCSAWGFKSSHGWY